MTGSGITPFFFHTVCGKMSKSTIKKDEDWK